MRTLLLILLFANVVLLAASRGWLGADVRRAVLPEQREPERAQQQLAPERIHVLTPSELRAPVACIELAPLAGDDADKLAPRLNALGARATVRPAADALSYMVHVPPYPTKAEADRAAADLKARGIGDLQVLPADAGPLRNAISLGVFKTEDAANTQLATLKARGVTNARITARPVPNAHAIVDVRGLPGDALGKLDELLKSAGAARTDATCPAS